MQRSEFEPADGRDTFNHWVADCADILVSVLPLIRRLVHLPAALVAESSPCYVET